MELGLSLGDTNTNTTTATAAAASSKSFFLSKNIKTSSSDQNHSKKKRKGLGFCMALGINSSNGKVQEQHDDDDDEENPEKSHDDEDDEGDEHTSEEGNINGNTPVQLDLLPLAPVPRRSFPQSLHWSSDNGSSENGSSGNGGLPAARGFDVNRVPAAGTEEVSSPNSIASSFRMDFGLFRSANIIGNKRNSDSGGGNDGGEPERASSRASDEDENGVNTRKKLRLSKEQSAYLEESFKEHHTLNPKQKLALAKQLNLRPRQVEVWFQNRRARTKLKQTEVDCEYLKRCCETLTEENRRLHKELQELRALKSSNPFYMQLPATTLTMCPSCERVATTTSATAAPPTTAAGTTTPKAPTPIPTTTITTTTTTSDSIPKAIPFLNSRPRFFPFNTTTNSPNHPHQSAAS
ncbi:homeobox-leucine zipper protein HAT14 [Nicotiana tabacum]|uniref:Homeobox-leucine zipper protein HAT14 n=1 Tax=Nicotiana tabacum TaxID=4097 RepID=A0A1S4B4Z5_TOBAC|nr:PREDICTED: homeobox-leucine zipper protein HOX11-like [Nicotiana tabacum]